MKSLLNILHTFTSLQDAVTASGMDLSYNPQAARNKINTLSPQVTWAAIVEGGDVYYIYNADIKLLHKFSPFSSCLDDAPLEVVYVNDREILFSGVKVPKTREGRAWFKKYDLIAA